ncbi:30S ribosomal protein S10 [Polaribacter irgensii 23-P]|uniref:30S ribosomal protein S10 n=1 Tax=Polaribacter irgensii 23-P TaxID=313594 RepID=A4C2Z1_9FLAO|nr:30S ribosomal protein S10 [Polaribacter irgensii 23-P]
MSGAFRERKTEKTKSALTLFALFFLHEILRKEMKHTFQKHNY